MRYIPGYGYDYDGMDMTDDEYREYELMKERQDAVERMEYELECLSLMSAEQVLQQYGTESKDEARGIIEDWYYDYEIPKEEV